MRTDLRRLIWEDGKFWLEEDAVYGATEQPLDPEDVVQRHNGLIAEVVLRQADVEWYKNG